MKIFREISVPGFDRSDFDVDQVTVSDLFTHSDAHSFVVLLFVNVTLFSDFLQELSSLYDNK